MELMKDMPNESVHLTFTSPPYYNARSYAHWDNYGTYLDFIESVFNEVHRITMEGRFLVINTSPIIEPRIDRAHMSKRYAIPFDIHSKITKIGWDFIDDILWVKPEPSVKNRNGNFSSIRNPLSYKPNSITEYLMVYRKHTDKLIDWNIKKYSNDIKDRSKVPDGYESSNVWYISPKASKFHPAIFPEELCDKVIRYYSYETDIILDTFMGIGTTGLVAQNLHRDFIGMELDENYFEIAKQRIINS